MDESSKANELRKTGKYDEAIKIYDMLWTENEDKFTAAGLLHCYRKQKQFEKAFELIEKTKERFQGFNWYKNEYSWTLISGQLNRLPDDPKTHDVVEIATKILAINPDQLAYNKAIFKVAKAAKKNEDWEILNEWLKKVDPEQLKIEEEGKDWSESEIWHYYRAIYLLETNKFEDAILFINQVKNKFKSKAKFFDRLIAKAFKATNDLEGSKQIYERLTNKRRADWWMLHEYAKLVLESGTKNEALKLMFRAGIAPGPMKNKVSLFNDIANLLSVKSRTREALIHYHLALNIRTDEGWSVPTELSENIEKINKIIPEFQQSEKTIDLFRNCKNIWKKELG
ncbi:tetratricopeptide repeat protein, partial [Ekhidna sp.]